MTGVVQANDNLSGYVLSDFSAADDADNTDLFFIQTLQTQRHKEKFIYKPDKIKHRVSVTLCS